MPRSARTFISSHSVISSTRSPLTQTTPSSGFSNPRISFRIVDFPEPLAPRMIFVCPVSRVKLMFLRITFSSNASDTLSSITIGEPGPSASSSAAERGVALCHGAGHWYNTVIRSLVTKKSTAITATDEATTALVVARPTP